MQLHEREQFYNTESADIHYCYLSKFQLNYDVEMIVFSKVLIGSNLHFVEKESNVKIREILYENTNEKIKDAIEYLLFKRIIRQEFTFGETVKLIGTMMTSSAKYIIRAERHPNEPDKPGGLT